MTNLEVLLARALMEVIVSIELTDDDDIDPDVANEITEPVGYMLKNSPLVSHAELIAAFRQAVELVVEESDVRTGMLIDFPRAMGIIGEDE